MDGLTLLEEARAAGLAVTAEGHRLRIRGPRRAGPIARRLIDNKSAVLTALTGQTEFFPRAVTVPNTAVRVEDLDPDWRIEWEERAATIEYDGGLPRERAEALALSEILGKMHRAGPVLGGGACLESK